MPKIEGDLAEALRLLRDYFKQKEIPFVLVGALVPALLLSSELGVRETRDADHVIKLASWTEWEAVIAYLDRALPRDLSDLIYMLERYESSGNESRRFEIASGVEGVTYDISGAYLLGRDVRENASEKALELVKGFGDLITDKHHNAINTILREENHLYSKDRRQSVYQLIQAFRKGLA